MVPSARKDTLGERNVASYWRIMRTSFVVSSISGTTFKTAGAPK